ncbi:MAG: protein arginine kinase [Candidatus Omnitrophica bacterium]|nr:protein arginine kinase [Candidatus Omnitrophota bacterium]
MQIKDLVKNPGQWLKGTGPNSDIIISSRIRLARNLEKMPFSHWAPENIRKKVLETIESALKSVDYMKGCLFIHMNTLDGVDKQLLLERHLVSREQLEPDGAKAVAISDQEIISIMINEEDHLRIQVIQSGFDLVEAYRLIGEVDNKLEQKLIFAFNPSLGYLTACPTNVGTGMRASAMMHLPALVMNKQIDKILQAIPKLNLTARGFYGEGTTASGNFFQISNQVTLGQKEEDIIDNLARVVRQVMEHEAATRQALLKKNRAKLEDMIWRAFGVLQNARIISSAETLDLLSSVRLGVDMGLIKQIDRKKVNELFLLTQPAHLQKIEGRHFKPDQRDLKRAQLIRSRLAK